MMDLTVGICMYNAEKYIEETLGCLLAQTRQDFKLLIVNDCSTDSSCSRVTDFFKEHPRQYELVDLPINSGLAAGRRYVEENATTRYILFVDADDDPLPQMVERLYDTITADEKLMAVGCYLKFMDYRGRKLTGGIYLGETSKERFIDKAKRGKLIFMQPTAIVDRYAALKVGGHSIDGFPDGKPRYRDLCEDLDLWTRMSDLYIEGRAIIVIPEVLCRYRKHDQAMSTTNTRGMLLRMRHIKTNVKRRRRGEVDLTFNEFLESLSREQLSAIEREANNADSFRQAYYNFKHGHIFAGFRALFATSPSYVWQKIRSNMLH